MKRFPDGVGDRIGRSTAVIALVAGAALVVSCATATPVGEVRLVAKAFGDLHAASAPLLDDLAFAERVQGQVAAETNAKKRSQAAPRAGDPCPTVTQSTAAGVAVQTGFCASDSYYYSQVSDPPGTAAFRRSLGAIGDYTELLLILAEGRNVEAVRAEYQTNLTYYTKRLKNGRPTYEQVTQSLGVPWEFVGITHALECGFNFSGHLHNGDPLTARTVQVPQGRPKTGAPPFTWFESALDALRLKGYDKVTDWSVPHMLYLFERYNGFGYRPRGVPTPYLWSFSNIYEKGKYVADGKFDPEKVSKQCGAGLILKVIRNG